MFVLLDAGELVAVAVDDEAAVVEGAVVEEVLDDEPLELHPPISSAMTATATPPAAMRERLSFSTYGPYLSPGRGAAKSRLLAFAPAPSQWATAPRPVAEAPFRRERNSGTCGADRPIKITISPLPAVISGINWNSCLTHANDSDHYLKDC
jgi:hypothetical protein